MAMLYQRYRRSLYRQTDKQTDRRAVNGQSRVDGLDASLRNWGIYKKRVFGAYVVMVKCARLS